MKLFDSLPREDPLYQAAGHQSQTKQRIEQCVIFVRLELYNRDLPCGPKAVKQRLDDFYHVKPMPSQRTIARILSRNGLTHGRTGLYG